jgi:hypothetical protein
VDRWGDRRACPLRGQSVPVKTLPLPALKMRIQALPTGLSSEGATCVSDLEGLLNLSLPEYLPATGTQKVELLTDSWTL